MDAAPPPRAFRWWLIPLGVCVGLAVASLRLSRLPDVFESYSVLMLAPKLQGANPGSIIVEQPEKFTETQIQLMLSQQVLHRVWAQVFDWAPGKAPPALPRLDASAGKGNTFLLRVRYTNFDYAQKIAVAWAQEFREFKRQQRQTLLGASEATLSRDALLYEQRLERARSTLEDFKKKNQVVSLQDAGLRAQTQLEQAKAAQLQLATTRQVIQGLTGEQLLTVSEDVLPVRREDQPGGPASATTITTAMMNRYIDLRLAVKRAENRVADLPADAPAAEAQRLKAELRNATADLKGLVELAEEQRQARLSALEVRANSYDPLIQRLTEEVFANVNVQNEYRRLQEDEAMYKQNLDVVRREAAAILSSNGDEEQFQQIEIGAGAAIPVGPNRPWLFAFGAVAGLVLGLFLAAAWGRPRPPSNGQPAPVAVPAPQSRTAP